MTDLESAQQLYTSIHLPYSAGDGFFLPPGKFNKDDMQACQYLQFFSADGNYITHYFTPAGVYWTTYTGRPAAIG